MEGSALFGRCGRLVPGMTKCECAEMTFEDLARRMRDARASLDAVQAETGAGLMCSACLPDLREHLVASGEEVPALSATSCVADEDLDAIEDEDPPAFAGAAEPR